MTRKMHAYRLDVIYPLGSTYPGWVPDKWEPWDEDVGFSWPRRRHYFTEASARARAKLLENWGCVVTIMRSDIITWDNVVDAPPREEIIAAVDRLNKILDGT